MAGAAARAHLDEDQRAVAVAQDQVELGYARMRTTGHPIIALRQDEPLALHVGQRHRLGIVADHLGAASIALTARAAPPT
jgi:hypothetical protein